ncbi:hypothetical protein ACXO4K_04330 [Lactobacillus delbrueckii subsp. bulgaricus]
MKLLILAANGQIARVVEERILTEDKSRMSTWSCFCARPTACKA